MKRDKYERIINIIVYGLTLTVMLLMMLLIVITIQLLIYILTHGVF